MPEKSERAAGRRKTLFPCLTQILPQETLYSWCSTNHFFSCRRHSASTGSALLSATHAARQHEFPHSIGKFIEVSGHTDDSQIALLRRHTIAGFYAPFLSSRDQQEIAIQASSGRSLHWNRPLLGSSRCHKVSHPLKWCMQCLSDDTENFGRSFWHVLHQFPTALLCERHNEPLCSSDVRSRKWRLPHKCLGQPPALSESSILAAKNAAAVGATLQAIESIDMRALRQFTLYRLQEMGVIHSVRGARHERVTRWFRSTNFSTIARIAQPQLTQLIDGSLIPSLLWRQRRDTAIGWILLWCALDWSSPHEAADTFFSVASGNGTIACTQLELFESLEARSWPAPEHVRQAFLNCSTYAEVMTRLTVSRADVVRWLESDPGLRSEWRSRLRERKETECIENISIFTRKSPQCALSDLEKNCSAELRWLREHNPSRLDSLLKSVPRANPKQSQFSY